MGEEPVRTYERPPLSKSVLGGEDAATVEWSSAHTDDLGLDWLLGERAVGLDVDEGTVRLGGGELAFDGLVLACGARPRRLPGQRDLAGVHVLRSLDDCLGVRADLDRDPGRVVVIGAGFIGSEVAATCRARGHEVTLVDVVPRPLQPVLGERVGDVVAGLHRANGVELRMETGVESIDGDERVERVELSDGDVLDADVVVVGIGVAPNTEWLADSGLPVDGDGVHADATTSVAPGITACGDVASWDSPRYGRLRIEHWDHAVSMGEAAGARLLADDDTAEEFDPVPWFWSDMYDARLQLAGRPVGEPEVVHGGFDEDRFLAVYRDGDTTIGAVAWNWPAKAARYRMALDDGLAWADRAL